MMASTTSPDISIQKKLEQEKIPEGHGGPCLNPLAGTGNQEISIAKPLATGHKSFSIEDILTRKIEQLEQGKNPSLLLYRAINLQDMNTTAALLELEKWNDTEGPEGNLPIHEAAIIGNQQLFDLVFRNTKNKWEDGGFLSRTALDYAAAYGHQEILETLLKSTDFEAGGKLPTRALRRAIETAKSNGYQNLANLLNERRLAIERTQKEVEFTNAVVGGDCVTVKGFLEEGVSKPDALEVAFTSGLTEMASILLQSMGKGHSYDLYNATIAAAKSGNFEAVNLLLQKMSGTGDDHGVAREAFVRARKRGNATFFRELLNSTKVSLGFALQVLAEAKDLEVVTWLLDYDTGGSIDGDSLTKSLHYAITPSPGWSGTTLSRRIGIVRVLLEHGADVNSPHKIWGSALRHAAASGEPEIVELLIRHGADINATGAFGGSSPMMIAISSGDLSTLRVLIEHGASFQNLKGIAGNGLQTASFLGFETVVKELLDLGLDINARLEPWGTPLMLALQGNHPSVAKLLLSRGANVKLGIPDCGTALHLAAMIGLEEMTKLLVAAGADVNAKGGIYCTALQAAVARGHRIIALFLLDHGADLHIQGGVHGNALQAADDMSDGLMIKLLSLSGAKATKPISSSLLS
jgi:ankyrin repeat protein